MLGTSIGLNLDQQSNGSHIYLTYHNGDVMTRKCFASFGSTLLVLSPLVYLLFVQRNEFKVLLNLTEVLIFFSTGEDTALSDQPYRYLTVDEMKSLGDDSLPIDVTRDERADNKMIQSTESAMITSMPPQALEDSISPQHLTLQQTSGRTVVDYAANADNVVIDRHPQHVGYVSHLFFSPF